MTRCQSLRYKEGEIFFNLSLIINGSRKPNKNNIFIINAFLNMFAFSKAPEQNKGKIELK